MSEEWAIFFENGVWILLRKDEYGNVLLREACSTLEQAIMSASYHTGAMVGLKLITKQP